jgi:hypothetical protein
VILDEAGSVNVLRGEEKSVGTYIQRNERSKKKKLPGDPICWHVEYDTHGEGFEDNMDLRILYTVLNREAKQTVKRNTTCFASCEHPPGPDFF